MYFRVFGSFTEKRSFFADRKRIQNGYGTYGDANIACFQARVIGGYRLEPFCTEPSNSTLFRTFLWEIYPKNALNALQYKTRDNLQTKTVDPGGYHFRIF